MQKFTNTKMKNQIALMQGKNLAFFASFGKAAGK